MQFSLAIISAIAALATASPFTTRGEPIDALKVSTLATTDNNLVAGPIVKATWLLDFYADINFGGASIFLTGPSTYYSMS